MKIRGCTSTDVRLTSPQDTFRKAARIIADVDTGALPVGDNDRLVGMVTDRDIAVRAVGEGKGFETPIAEVMSEEIEHWLDDEDSDSVAQKMGDLKVRRLPVLNRDKRLVGIIFLGDLAKHGNGLQSAAALGGVSRPGVTYMHKHA